MDETASSSSSLGSAATHHQCFNVCCVREYLYHFHRDVYHDSGSVDCRAGVIMNDMSTIKA